MLRTVPARAFDEQFEYDIHLKQFTAQHPLNTKWLFSISRNLEVSNTPPNVYEVWCYEEAKGAEAREFILVAYQVTLTKAKQIIGWIARIDPAHYIPALEKIDATLECWYNTRVNTRVPRSSKV